MMFRGMRWSSRVARMGVVSGVLIAAAVGGAPWVQAADGKAHAANADAGAPPVAGFRAEFLTQLQDVEGKLVVLAGAMPQSRLTWRPGREVRSVAEVYLHVAAGNYALPAFIGYKPPEDVNLKTLEKSTTEKAVVIAAMQRSFEYVRGVVSAISDADLDKPATMFGTTKTTVRGVLSTLANHQHEHLGQSIAYARMNRVVPPWTLAEHARMRAAKP
jgi:uncharacterized damage-inducible protein DinB